MNAAKTKAASAANPKNSASPAAAENAASAENPTVAESAAPAVNTTASAPNGPKFSIGIDLGTTHCALAYVDIAASDGEKTVHGVLDIPQLSAPGATENLPLLPSFLYLPHTEELAAGDLTLPWSATQDFAVGEFARTRGALTPIRLVSSAKSWLCHPGVDRRAAILPADAPPEVARVSPLQASTHYLTHLRQAWDAAHPEAPFDEQDVTITIRPPSTPPPAS